MIFKENKGQSSIELILIVGLILILVISTSIIFNNENELNTAMISSKNGALEGIAVDGMAIYPKNTFNEYKLSNPLLTIPNDIKIIKIEKTNNGYDERYNKTRIQLKIYVSSPNIKTTTDKNSVGARINYYARKNIAETFHTTHLSNALYNPSFSNSYSFTTANVVWV